METSTSIQVAIAKQMWKLIRMAFRFLKRRISNSSLLKRPPNDIVWSLREYEFSCSNSPAAKKSWSGRRRRFHNGRYFYSGVDEAAIAATVQRVFDMLNAQVEGPSESAMPSPMVMPGFGGTPVRQLRVTDSPFPEAKGCKEEEAQVSKAAEEFISSFYRNLRRENINN